VNPRTRDIDQLPLGAILERILDEDAGVPEAVRAALPAIERAGEVLLDTLRSDGRWFNLGAGTSGRIGVLDAAEIPPSYGLSPERVQAIMAGGPDALSAAVEGAEDDREAGARELLARGFCRRDALVALSASGQTPFVIGGVEHARSVGGRTIGLTCTPASPLVRLVDCPIVVLVGPEAIAGSTRMKGGLAQKIVLQMLSTSVMVRMGRVRGNLMIELGTRSSKLRERAIRILMELSGQERGPAGRALGEAQGSVSRALELLERLG
jgi:N-acetylmuramic acid 6-phosphate etherase